jgi:hypothetical protein
MILKKRFLLIFFFTGILCTAQQQKDTLRVLFVGNSYTYFEKMPDMVANIAKSSNTKLITKMSAPGGARLREHWLGLRNIKTKEIIQNGSFDIVVLQGQSMAALKRPDTLKKYAALFSNYIKKHRAKPYFYLTWAREKTPERQQEINTVYTEISKHNKATLVPVGKAWELAKKLRPHIKLYTPDGSHPNKLGAYLTASVFASMLLDKLPIKIEKNTSSLPQKDIKFCKTVTKKILSKK